LQWAVFDAREVLANRSPAFDPALFVVPRVLIRSDMLRVCCGDVVTQQLAFTSIFMIGVGAIGCELMKNFAMLGIATNAGATVHITDPGLVVGWLVCLFV
jgi:ubiquitin-activating enzyme E1